MPNSVLSQITLPSGTTYDLKDAQARSDIATLQTIASGGMHYMGISSTEITEGGTENPTIDNEVKTMSASISGAVVIYGEKEYVWNGAKWQEFGSTGSLKGLAFKDQATGNIIPTGNVSAPTISVSAAGTTTTVNSITEVGTLPSWSGTVSGETLTINWNAGTLPTKGENTTVKTGDASYEASAPSFTGTQSTVTVS